MRREWEPEELIACWTLVNGDAALVGNKSGPTRLGFALLLKLVEIEGRFPRDVAELRGSAVGYVARQVGVDPDDLAAYDSSGRTIKLHRAQIRGAFGFRESSRADEERLAAWLSEEVCPVELVEDRWRDALLARCRADRVEPPDRLDRVLAAAGAGFDQRFCVQVVSRLSAATRSRLEAGGRGRRRRCRGGSTRSAGRAERNKIAVLGRVRSSGLPENLFAGYGEKLVAAWRARAAHCYPSDLRASPAHVRLTMLAAPGPGAVGAAGVVVDRRRGERPDVPAVDLLHHCAQRRRHCFAAKTGPGPLRYRKWIPGAGVACLERYRKSRPDLLPVIRVIGSFPTRDVTIRVSAQ